MDVVTVIRKVESEFDDIYRITTENGLVLDIPETKKPQIESMFEYHINQTDKYDNKEYTIMHGIFFNSGPNNIFVSFGGLLASIPITDTHKSGLGEQISLAYKIQNPL